MDPGFDPTRIMLVGLKLACGSGSDVPVQGTCHVDQVSIFRRALGVPASDHVFDFDALEPQNHEDKLFGHGPYFEVDPGWGALAWAENDVRVEDGIR